MENLNIIFISQARVGSTRFPEKVLQEVDSGLSMLALHLQRLKQSQFYSKIIVATTFEEKSEKIEKIAASEGVFSFKGSTDDVLDRFYQAAKDHQPDYIVRVTSDCPFIDANLIDDVISFAVKNNFDYASNTLTEDFPDGQDVEVIRWSSLEKAWNDAKLTSEREHVTPYIRKNSDFKGGTLFKTGNYSAKNKYSKLRMTVDEPKDLQAIQTLIKNLGTKKTWIEYSEFILNNPEMFNNQKIIRNEGYFKSLQNDKNSN